MKVLGKFFSKQLEGLSRTQAFALGFLIRGLVISKITYMVEALKSRGTDKTDSSEEKRGRIVMNRPTRNPMRRQGSRNIYCSYYSACLDHAVKHSWRYWDCSDCTNKSTKRPIAHIHEAKDSFTYCELPLRFCRELMEGLY